jgi:hypothetical protein
VISIRTIAAAWNRFFFEPASPLPVALYRIALGLTLLADAALKVPYVKDFYGPDGLVSLEGTRHLEVGRGISLFSILPQADETAIAVFALSCLAMLTMTAGLFTRASAAVVFLTLTSLHHRNPAILNGCDSLLRIMPLFLAMSSAGERLSVDAWLRRRRGVAPRDLVSPWAHRMMQLQLSILYVTTVLLKFRGQAWIDGTALYYIVRLPEFARFPVPYLPEHLWALKAATWGTLVVESALGVLVWVKELRRPVLCAGVLLHLGIEYSMNVPIMQWANLGAFTLFLEESDIERALRFLRRRLKWDKAAVESREQQSMDSLKHANVDGLRSVDVQDERASTPSVVPLP